MVVALAGGKTNYDFWSLSGWDGERFPIRVDILRFLIGAETPSEG